MPAERDAEQIQRDIEQSRVALAAAVDQLAYRGNPKRLAEQAKRTLRERAQSPAGIAVIAAVGGVVALLIVKRVNTGRANAAHAKALRGASGKGTAARKR